VPSRASSPVLAVGALTGAPEDLRDDLAVAATHNLKRGVGLSASTDWAATPALDRMLTYLETKTVWRPPHENCGRQEVQGPLARARVRCPW
jgi:hypothetical protein